MAFGIIYDEIKSTAMNFRNTLMNALVTEKFRKMLDAMSTSATISNTVLNQMNISAYQFKSFDNYTGLIAPSGLTNSPTDSSVPRVTFSWTGETLNRFVGSELVRLIPVSEMTYEPENVISFKSGVSDKLNRLAVVLMVPISDPHDPPANADFHDYKYAYYLPKYVEENPPNMRYTVGDKATVYLQLEWSYMMGEEQTVACEIEWVRGRMATYDFGYVNGIRTKFDIWIGCEAMLSYESYTGTKQFLISPDAVIYTYSCPDDAFLQISDLTSFPCSNPEGMYMLAVTYTLTNTWVYLGVGAISLPPVDYLYE